MLSLSGMSSLSSTGKTRIGGAAKGGLIPAAAIEDKFGVQLDASIAGECRAA